jgi:hypothetical protein
VPKPLAYLGQAVVYALIAVLLGYFSTSPSYQRFSTDQAQITLSFTHGGKRKGGECRRLTTEEIAALPGNKRRAMDCERERLPVLVELELNGELHLSESLRPGGLSKDGPSQIHRHIQVPVGRHHLVVRLRDSDRSEGYDFTREIEIDLVSLQHFVIDFRSEQGGFFFSSKPDGDDSAVAATDGRS